jgi:hypothetical protein
MAVHRSGNISRHQDKGRPILPKCVSLRFDRQTATQQNHRYHRPVRFYDCSAVLAINHNQSKQQRQQRTEQHSKITVARGFSYLLSLVTSSLFVTIKQTWSVDPRH